MKKIMISLAIAPLLFMMSTTVTASLNISHLENLGVSNIELEILLGNDSINATRVLIELFEKNLIDESLVSDYFRQMLSKAGPDRELVELLIGYVKTENIQLQELAAKLLVKIKTPYSQDALKIIFIESGNDQVTEIISPYLESKSPQNHAVSSRKPIKLFLQ